MMYIIMGRTASGKDYFADLLKQKGLTGVKSRTTRPPRSDDENTHIFVSQDDAGKTTDRVAYTKIGDYEYFATERDILGKDFYIVDPIGLESLAHNMPSIIFNVIYIEADREDRKRHFVARQSASKEDAEKLFDERDAAETEQFDKFEAKIHALMQNKHAESSDTQTAPDMPENIQCIHVFSNKFEKAPDDMNIEAESAVSQKKCHNTLTQMVLEAIELGILIADNNNQVIVHERNHPDTPTYVSPERFASILMCTPEGLSTFIKTYLGRSHCLTFKSKA